MTRAGAIFRVLFEGFPPSVAARHPRPGGLAPWGGPAALIGFATV
jgi:hypothetical protein